jgi:hypothetical protein
MACSVKVIVVAADIDPDAAALIILRTLIAGTGFPLGRYFRIFFGDCAYLLACI